MPICAKLSDFLVPSCFFVTFARMVIIAPYPGCRQYNIQLELFVVRQMWLYPRSYARSHSLAAAAYHQAEVDLIDGKIAPYTSAESYKSRGKTDIVMINDPESRIVTCGKGKIPLIGD